MAIEGLAWCDFVVWLAPGVLSAERITYKPEFWLMSLLSALMKFYTKHAKDYLSLQQPDVSKPLASATVSSSVACSVCNVHDQPVLRVCKQGS